MIPILQTVSIVRITPAFTSLGDALRDAFYPRDQLERNRKSKKTYIKVDLFQ